MLERACASSRADFAWLATLRHIAREGRVFVIGCGQAVRRDDIPDRYAFKRLYPEGRESTPATAPSPAPMATGSGAHCTSGRES